MGDDMTEAHKKHLDKQDERVHKEQLKSPEYGTAYLDYLIRSNERMVSLLERIVKAESRPSLTAIDAIHQDIGIMNEIKATILNARSPAVHELLRQDLAEKQLKEKPDVTAPYGYCPRCGSPGELRERSPFGDTICAKGCRYPHARFTKDKPGSVDQTA